MTARQLAYRAYLQSVHWAQLRHAVLTRDGFRCVRCKSPHRVEPHHLFYRDRFEDSRPEDLVTLCRRHHKAEHGVKQSKKRGAGRQMVEARLARVENFFADLRKVVASSPGV